MVIFAISKMINVEVGVRVDEQQNNNKSIDMRKIITMTAFGIVAFAGFTIQKVEAAAGLPTFYGSVIFDDNWYDAEGKGQAQYGFYSFQPKSDISLSPVMIHGNLNINGGGTYSDRKIHYHLWEMYADDGSDTGITFHNYFCKVDTDNWDMENVVDYSDNQDNIAYDMTYDPVSRKIYAVQWGPFEDDNAYFAEVDGDSGESVNIAKVKCMSALACDNFGRIYGIRTSDGMTCYLDQRTGEVIELGFSGIVPKYVQSATVDPATNIIYWASMDENGKSELRTVNVITGATDKIGDFNGDAEITCLFVEAPRGTLGAPGELTDVVLSTSGSKSKISAKLPTKTFDGNDISGMLTFEWYIDGKLAGSIEGSPGQPVNLEAEVLQGRHVVVAQARSAAGEGPRTYRDQWCGEDVPAAVQNLHFSIADGIANLTWQAPSEGLRGGSIDPIDTKYKVLRYPGAEIVAMGITQTSFTEKLPAAAATYYYTVTATNSLGEGGTATSNTIYTGSSSTLPYFQDFESEDSANDFTIINTEEGRGWFRWHNTAQNFKAMACRFNKLDASDNWLILPPLPFVTGQEYKLSYRVKVFDSDSPEKYEITIGRDATVASQTALIQSARTIKNTDWQLVEVPFKVQEDGLHNIGIHCVSPAMAYYLIVDDISVSQTSDVNIVSREANAVVAADGEIVATGEGRMVIYNIDGRKVCDINAEGEARVTVEPGIYIVTFGDRCFKLLLK